MCDSMIVGKAATVCDYTIFGKNSDRSPNEPQSMILIPAADHAPGTMVQTTRIAVEQAAHTYAVMLSKPSWIWGGEIGINEKGVVIGNEAVISKAMSTTDVALLGMDVLRLALERADTAEKAVNVIAELMERYGQGGNCSFDGVFHYDNAYLVADANEIWMWRRRASTSGQPKRYSSRHTASPTICPSMRSTGCIPMPSPTPGRQATGWKSPSTGAVLMPTGSL